METGSVADWVAALGGLLSIAATGYIAVREYRRSEHLESSGAELEQVRRNQVIDEAEKLANAATARFDQFVALVGLGGGQSGTGINELHIDMTSLHRRIQELQRFPNNSAAIYMGIAALAEACVMRTDFAHHSTSYAEVIAKEHVEKIGQAMAALKLMRQINVG